MRRLALVPLVALALAVPAYATDGVLEINQACAVQTGCFAGDAAGFPVTIVATGSYRLTGNLDASGYGASAIAITADDVTVDLGGFTIKISGPGTMGVESTSGGTALMNGNISKSPIYGGSAISLAGESSVVHVRASGGNPVVLLGSRCRLAESIVVDSFDGAVSLGEDCHAYRNVISGFNHEGGTSLAVGSKSIVENNEVSATDAACIGAGDRSRVVGNVVRPNGTSIVAGIGASSNSTILDNSASGFPNVAIRCGDGCTMRGNTTNGNGTGGLSCGRGCLLSQNTANGNGGNSPTAFGLRCNGACTVKDNTATDNTGFGLLDDVGGSGYGGNNFSNNNGGNANPQVSGGIEMGPNVCGGDTVCP